MLVPRRLAPTVSTNGSSNATRPDGIPHAGEPTGPPAGSGAKEDGATRTERRARFSMARSETLPAPRSATAPEAPRSRRAKSQSRRPNGRESWSANKQQDGARNRTAIRSRMRRDALIRKHPPASTTRVARDATSSSGSASFQPRRTAVSAIIANAGIQSIADTPASRAATSLRPGSAAPLRTG